MEGAQEDPRASLGLVHVITGDGRGKTTAAFGLALRAIGRGLKVAIVQFMKGFEYGEVLAAKETENLDVTQFGRGEFVDKEKPEQVDLDYARDALRYGKEVVNSGKYDIVVLDEVNVALDFNLITIDDVVTLVKEKPKNLELVLTGRNAPRELMDLADYVSEIEDIKHPYQRGIQGRKGIEY